MTEQRVPFGSMVKALQDFNDYRSPSNKANYSYKKGDIVPVDSILVYTVSSLVKNGLFQILENEQWEGFEQDYVFDKNEFIQYRIFKIRFKNSGNFVVLPNLNKDYTYKVQENIIINDGSNSFKIKYYDGVEFPDFEILPNKAYSVIYVDDESDKGRWLFSPFLYKQDSGLEISGGSEHLEQEDSSKIPGSYKVYENLDQYDFVRIFINEEALPTIRKSSATSVGKKADGFVKQSYVAGQFADVYSSGIIIDSSETLISEKSYFLSNQQDGKYMSDPVETGDHIYQKIGEALSGTELKVKIESPYILS